MRCDCCPLGSDEDVCLEAENEYGIEHKDGVLGCKHPRNWVEKRDNEYAEHLGEMGTDMGIEMMFSEDDLKKAIKLCKHTIGLDRSKPYHRHGKAFYKPYRNYFAASSNGEKLLDRLSGLVVERRETERSVLYCLTPDGLKWLERQLNITIKEYK